MDINGTELRTILLPDLQEYSDPEYYADKLYVQGDYIFINGTIAVRDCHIFLHSN